MAVLTSQRSQFLRPPSYPLKISWMRLGNRI